MFSSLRRSLIVAALIGTSWTADAASFLYGTLHQGTLRQIADKQHPEFDQLRFSQAVCGGKTFPIKFREFKPLPSDAEPFPNPEAIYGALYDISKEAADTDVCLLINLDQESKAEFLVPVQHEERCEQLAGRKVCQPLRAKRCSKDTAADLLKYTGGTIPSQPRRCMLETYAKDLELATILSRSNVKCQEARLLRWSGQTILWELEKRFHLGKLSESDPKEQCIDPSDQVYGEQSYSRTGGYVDILQAWTLDKNLYLLIRYPGFEGTSFILAEVSGGAFREIHRSYRYDVH